MDRKEAWVGQPGNEVGVVPGGWRHGQGHTTQQSLPQGRKWGDTTGSLEHFKYENKMI